MGGVCPGIDFDTEDDGTALYRAAGLEQVQTTTGPFAMMTPTGFLRDEGPLGTARFIGKAISRPAYLARSGGGCPG
jgi:hypothetical protein